MDIEAFRASFWRAFGSSRNAPDDSLRDPDAIRRLDLCPDVEGMLSIRKQRLLNMAFDLLPENECYFEVGTYQGKSLLSAMLGNPPRKVYAADDFSLFDVNTLAITLGNLEKYQLREQVTFFDCDFRNVLTRQHIPEPVGLYFYDGAHDEQSQYDGIHLVEHLLADEALVLVDDWRLAADSRAYAKAGTMRATRDSPHQWRLLYELPARFNGDLGLWWNGVGVLGFRRQSN